MADPFSGVEAFVAIARCRSFRAAARELGVSSPAVSKALRRLEEDVGVRLLDRTTRRVELTAEGRLFVEHCQEALTQVQVGRQRLEQARSVVAGELVVALSSILGPTVVRHLPEFGRRYPGLKVRMTFADRMSQLVEEHIDVALRIGSHDATTAISRKVLSTRWVTVAAPAYVAERGQPECADDLAGHDCAAYRSPRGVVVPWEFCEPGSLRTMRVRVEPRLVVDQGQLLLDAAMAGAGLVHVLDFMVQAELQRGTLVRVLPSLECKGPAVHALCKPGHQQVPKVRALLDFIRDKLASAHSLPGR